MKGDADSRAALRIIGSFVLQAAARGDTAGMLEHLAVYMAAVNTSKEQTARAGDDPLILKPPAAEPAVFFLKFTPYYPTFYPLHDFIQFYTVASKWLKPQKTLVHQCINNKAIKQVAINADL